MLSLSNTWGIVISNIADGTQPSSTPGTTLTPGNNTYPAYAEILGDTSDETFFMRINVSGIGANALNKSALLKLGFDFGGGTTYTDLTISDLLVSSANTVANGTPGDGVSYEFPVRIPAGTSVAASCSVNNATVGNAYVWISLFGQPSHPEVIRYGSFVRSFGATGASSSGTAVTPGTTSEGSYSASLGTTADDLWAWEFGYGINSATSGNGAVYVDVAASDDAGTTKRVLIANGQIITNANELISKSSRLTYADVKSGATLYMRGQTSNGVTTNNNGMIYGVGG